ncbi:hypothetical protein AZI86_06305 [Bdellovibrio bacteriovorus]|uniref:SCP domain-containing protein n=1 Tax=Bdellovibrio bacteriovorus TaxID=959 RepID=A0A150WQQ1_BDEBC|nr:hypothetical protein [Bdellovibrio bacteriovorus]KYG66654.1 hypothetical protein AZI86_06305 [Bdellovibrio bacteriovorus]
MEMKKRFKSFTLIGLAMFLAAFSGQEKFVELEGYLNARSSAAFRKIDTNVKAVLATGTRGEILEKKKLRSGNYGLKVRVMSGPYTGKSYWVYYNVSNPDLALYDAPPQTWDQITPEKTTIDQAAGAETLRPIKGIDDTDKASELAYQETKPKENNDARDAIDAITYGQQQVNRVPVPSKRPECTECSQNIENVPVPASEEQLADALIGPSAKQMSPRCATFINRDGEFGKLGRAAMKIMSEPRYKNAFTKSNALGKFCPNFNTFTESEKLQAWTWFWASLANEETQCVQEIEHPMYVYKRGRRIKINNELGWGMFAAEKSAANRAARRGDACKVIFGSGEGQLRCAIDTMKDTTLDDGHTASGDKGSYWGPVRRGNTQIMPHMKRFKACF